MIVAKLCGKRSFQCVFDALSARRVLDLVPRLLVTIFIATFALISQQVVSAEDVSQLKGNLVYAGVIREARDWSKGIYFVKSNGIAENLVIPLKSGSELNNHQTRLIGSHLGALILDGTILLIDNDTMESRILPGYTSVTNIFLGQDLSRLYFVDSGNLYQYIIDTKEIASIADLSMLEPAGDFEFSSFEIDEAKEDIYYSYDAAGSENRIRVYHLKTKKIDDLRKGSEMKILVSDNSVKVYFADEKKGLGVFDPSNPNNVKYLIMGEIDRFAVLNESLIAFSLVDRNNFKGAPLLRGFSLYDSGKISRIEDLIVTDAVILE